MYCLLGYITAKQMGRPDCNFEIHHSSAGKNIFHPQPPFRHHHHSPPSTICMDGIPCNSKSNALLTGQRSKKSIRRVVGPVNKRSEVKISEDIEDVNFSAGETMETRASDDIEDINFSIDETLVIRASLLKWYDDNQRDLPWRRISKECNKSCNEEDAEESEERAYAVWVSEVMLQQTRVQTVIDYFNKWMNKWPTLHHLAQASLEEVNDTWAGLGYYRRARFLLEGARQIVGEGGGFPKEVSALRKVKGIGNYTAGAIASIAFKQVVPVVDGNVVRVIARLRAISTNPRETVAVKNIWKLAGQLVDLYRPGDFNQALMELGATVCSVSNPSCNECPIATKCHAQLLSRCNDSVRVTDYPIKVVKAKQRHEFAAVSVVEILEGSNMEDPQSNSKFILVKRAEKGLLAGLWEFPSVLVSKEADSATRREAIDHFLKSSVNLDCRKSSNVVLREEVGNYIHVFSHIRLKMHVELIVLHLNGSEKGQDGITWKYVDKQQLSTMGLTSGVRKVYDMIENYKRSRLSSLLPKARPFKISRKSSNKKVAESSQG